MQAERILVVGTTSDYVDLIQQRYPGRSLFVTDRRHRALAVEPPPPPDGEVLSDLSRPAMVMADLDAHLQQWGLRPAGVACFDCDSLDLAARVAHTLGLPFPDPEAVAAARSKLLSKQRWQAAGLSCPRVADVATRSEAIHFLTDLGRPIVLKPTDGSGSELVFVCRTAADIEEAFDAAWERTAAARTQAITAAAWAPAARTQASTAAESSAGTPPALQAGGARRRSHERWPRPFLAEEFVEGEEYSCDLQLAGNSARIIRVARKVMAAHPPGTALAYQLPAALPAALPAGMSAGTWTDFFAQGARSLGLRRAICMIDFIVREGRPYLIELAPRPGGDCLPALIQESCGLDMLGAALDFAAGVDFAIPPAELWRPLVGLRLLAPREGTIDRIDARSLRSDPRIWDVCLMKRPGHRVVLPPRDYDSRVLGYAVFDPLREKSLPAQCDELSGLLTIEWRDASPARPGDPLSVPAAPAVSLQHNPGAA